jgi:hypothetical protein
MTNVRNSVVPDEEAILWYQQAVRNRDKQKVAMAHEKRPDALWSAALRGLSDADRVWLGIQFAPKKIRGRKRRGLPHPDEYDRFPDGDVEGVEAEYDP